MPDSYRTNKTPLEKASSLSPALEEILADADTYYGNLAAYCALPRETRNGLYDETIHDILHHLERAYPDQKRDGLLAYMYFLFCAGHWRTYKTAYSLDPDLMRALSDTEEAPVYKEILKRLPYPAFFLYAPDGAGKVGYFVNIETPDGTDETLVSAVVVTVDNELFYRNQGCALWFKDGQTISEALFADPDISEKYGGAAALNTYRSIITPALMASYYLCSENAVIRKVKTAKEKRPKRSNGKPLNIQRWDVAFREGTEFHRMYRDSAGDSDKRYDRANSVRPHVRRAHWHHYWVGKGRAKLVVKWIAPVFVMGSQKDITTVNHDIALR